MISPTPLDFTRSQRRKMNPRASGAADAIAEDLRTNPRTLSQVNEARRWIGQNVAGSADASERTRGVEMMRRIDAFLDRLQPADMDGTNDAAALVDDLMTARNAATRRKRHRSWKRPIQTCWHVVKRGTRLAAVKVAEYFNVFVTFRKIRNSAGNSSVGSFRPRETSSKVGPQRVLPLGNHPGIKQYLNLWLVPDWQDAAR